MCLSQCGDAQCSVEILPGNSIHGATRYPGRRLADGCILGKSRRPGLPQSLAAKERRCVLCVQVKFSAAVAGPASLLGRVAVHAGSPVKNGVFYGGTSTLPLACLHPPLQDIPVSSRSAAPKR